MEGGPRRLGARRGRPEGGAARTHNARNWECALGKFEQLRRKHALHSWQTFVLLGW